MGTCHHVARYALCISALYCDIPAFASSYFRVQPQTNHRGRQGTCAGPALHMGETPLQMRRNPAKDKIQAPLPPGFEPPQHVNSTLSGIFEGVGACIPILLSRVSPGCTPGMALLAHEVGRRLGPSRAVSGHEIRAVSVKRATQLKLPMEDTSASTVKTTPVRYLRIPT